MVDSCEDSRGLARSAAVTYLTGIDVDLASQMKCVLATRWHDDRIEGMSELVDRCATAIFCCPVTFNSKEFLTLASFYADFDPYSGQLKTPQRMSEDIDNACESIERVDNAFILTCGLGTCLFFCLSQMNNM